MGARVGMGVLVGMAVCVCIVAVSGCGQRSPDGLGVCCPMAFDPCGCTDEHGGFAISSLECGGPATCDGRWARDTDSHGCPVWRDVTFGPATVCCGCPTEYRPA
jgi:hypothetical protein